MFTLGICHGEIQFGEFEFQLNGGPAKKRSRVSLEDKVACHPFSYIHCMGYQVAHIQASLLLQDN